MMLPGSNHNQKTFVNDQWLTNLNLNESIKFSTSFIHSGTSIQYCYKDPEALEGLPCWNLIRGMRSVTRDLEIQTQNPCLLYPSKYSIALIFYLFVAVRVDWEVTILGNRVGWPWSKRQNCLDWRKSTIAGCSFDYLHLSRQSRG